MSRIGFVLKVKAELIDEYRQVHQSVWPEMLDALSRHGWHNYSLFIRSDGTLFGYFETPEDFQIALNGMAEEDVNIRWQAEMARFFEGKGGPADELIEELAEIFHLD